MLFVTVISGVGLYTAWSLMEMTVGNKQVGHVNLGTAHPRVTPGLYLVGRYEP